MVHFKSRNIFALYSIASLDGAADFIRRGCFFSVEKKRRAESSGGGNLGAHLDEREAQDRTAHDLGRQQERIEGLVSVEEVISRVQENLLDDVAKPSMTDLVRLMEIRRDLAQVQGGPLSVGWVDECPTNTSEE